MTNEAFLSAGDSRLADLVDLVRTKTELSDYPQASTVEQNVGPGCAAPQLSRRAQPVRSA